MDIPASTLSPSPPPYTQSAAIQPAVSKGGPVVSQQNTGNISVNVSCAPSQQEPKLKSESISQPQYVPQVQTFPQPQMNQVPFQQPQFQQVQVQQPQFQQVQFQQPQYVVNQQPVICSGNLGPEPCLTTCTNCRERITTNVIYKPGALTWVVCLTLILFGFVFGCCLIPFCMDICQDAYHSCPKCHTSLHVHKRL
ncbi:lipopolysaccharide-induced tumor necrosis factor-alpha factor homolog [Brienomyrus brachyistius]|uniref:lipopolysaccharide-induced tumor necrosis factor-alpha factor homolog n=1 Tax=Brienomyrus brachyistius TaxID=42636 RepID=UPI0020B1E01F|nr:lipopolysaccharide-induced tumor necrosis factor-alpha factor homolog [Brienomyrus brachyistius]